VNPASSLLTSREVQVHNVLNDTGGTLQRGRLMVQRRPSGCQLAVPNPTLERGSPLGHGAITPRTSNTAHAELSHSQRKA